ncbi:hypothetical protein E2C01_098220 [Portunus trituberculatus]|uniref:Uncharacterized protein n=1 Tax=Portunus trituberculatus TaxID=210409 RepID=A0A5B7K740_PORTR|nr:hypothetical protein [Portunus trituberculatus]
MRETISRRNADDGFDSGPESESIYRTLEITIAGSVQHLHSTWRAGDIWGTLHLTTINTINTTATTTATTATTCPSSSFIIDPSFNTFTGGGEVTRGAPQLNEARTTPPKRGA